MGAKASKMAALVNASLQKVLHARQLGLKVRRKPGFKRNLDLREKQGQIGQSNCRRKKPARENKAAKALQSKSTNGSPQKKRRRRSFRGQLLTAAATPAVKNAVTNSQYAAGLPFYNIF